MKSIQIEYPESWLAVMNTSAEAFGNEARMASAVKLFEVGKLSSGQAAQFADMTKRDFLLACPQWGVPTVAWDDDEIANEFRER